MATAYHLVHYRSFSLTDAKDGVTLESLCRGALDKANPATVALWERVEDRIQDLADAEGRKISLNKVADLSTAIFGELCLVQQNGLQALLALNASKVKLSDITTAEIFDLNESTAPKGTQFIRGLAYWLAINNNLFFIKTQFMTADFIHNYISWLISTVAPPPHVAKFQAEFDRSKFAGDIGDIKSLRVSGKGVPQLAIVDPESKDYQKVVRTSRKIAEESYVFEKAREFAAVMFGDEKAKSLVESLGPGEYLTAEAALRVQGRRTEKSKAKMKEIANELADSSDAKVQVQGKDGNISDDDTILRTRMPFNLPHEGSNLLDYDNVADQLQEVYSRFVRDGKIGA